MLALEAFSPPPFPSPDDPGAWAALVQMLNGLVETQFVAAMPSESVLPRSTFQIPDGPTVYVLAPPQAPVDASAPLFLDFHGGGLILGGGVLSWRESVPNALTRTGVTWAPDYRMPPAHRYPAALDDAVAVYRRALEERAPDRIVITGTSAGGNLAASLLLRVKAEGLPMPAALLLLSPHVDLTESGDTFHTNDGIDTVLTASLVPASLLYAAGADLADPYLSPLFGDLVGFPPTLLQSGTRDRLLSSTVRMHRALLAAGVEAELHVFEAMPHTAFTGTAPEDEELRAELRRFESVHLR